MLENRENQYKFSDGVVEAIMDDNFANRLTQEIIVLDPVCELVNLCQSNDTNIADATKKWINFDLPVVNEQFEEMLEGRRHQKVINPYGLAANYL